MNAEDENTDDDAAGEAAFDAGFTEEKTGTPKPEPAAEKPREPEQAKPEYVQLTKDDYEFLRGAANKVTSLEQQQSKAFGTIGGIQRLVNELKTQTPQGAKVALPDNAFDEMEKDFPELAQQIKKALSGITGTGGATAHVDDTKIEQMLTKFASAREVENLEDAYPDWRDIVGAPKGAGEAPDAESPFRKWLATKPAAYQERLNATDRGSVIERAISLFRRETRTQAKPTPAPRVEPRAERLREAVRPRGDGAVPRSRDTDEEAFLAGYSSA